MGSCLGSHAGNRVFIEENKEFSTSVHISASSSRSAVNSFKKVKYAKGRGLSIEAAVLNLFDFHKMTFVYEGAFGVVYAAVSIENEYSKVALKCFGYSTGLPDQTNIEREIDLLYKIQGVIIDPPEGHFAGKLHHQEYPIIVTELLQGETLSRRIRKKEDVSERLIATIFRNVMLALEGLHSKHCIHR
jgi:serine/threonine protein kinase